jgi:hypothetical protein
VKTNDPPGFWRSVKSDGPTSLEPFKLGPVYAKGRWPLYRPAPALEDQATGEEKFETGVKVIDWGHALIQNASLFCQAASRRRNVWSCLCLWIKSNP